MLKSGVAVPVIPTDVNLSDDIRKAAGGYFAVPVINAEAAYAEAQRNQAAPTTPAQK